MSIIGIKILFANLFFIIWSSFVHGMESTTPSPQQEKIYMPDSLLKIATLASLKKWNQETPETILKQLNILPYECKELLINEAPGRCGLEICDVHDDNLPKLFAMGADFERCNKIGETPLLWYLQKNEGEKAIAVLTSESVKPNVNHRNIYGACALDLVEKIQSEKSRDTIKALLYEKGLSDGFTKGVASKITQVQGFLSALIPEDEEQANAKAASESIVKMRKDFTVEDYQEFVLSLSFNIKKGLPTFVNQSLNPEGMTLLHYATTPEEVEKLLITGADINVKTKHQETPLHTMLQRGDCEAALRLIKKISPKSGYCNTSDAYEMKPLCYAVLAEHVELVKDLMKDGSDAEYAHIDPRKSLFLAPVVFLASTKNEAIVKRVLKRKTITNLHAKIRLEAMARAVEERNYFLFDKLIPIGKTLNSYFDCNDDHSFEDHSNILSYLLYKRRNVGLTNLLTDSKYLEHLDVNAKSSKGITPLMMAARRSKKELSIAFPWSDIIIRLFHLGGLVNESDNKGSAPLHYAADAGSLIAAQELLKRGALVNVQDADGNTPLHCAVIKKREGLVKFLAAMTDLTIKNKDNKRPCDITNEEGYKNDYAYLLEPNRPRKKIIRIY